MALLIKLPTVLPRLLSYHSWIISPPLQPICVNLLHLLASTLCGLPQTGHKSRYFSIDSNSNYLCARRVPQRTASLLVTLFVFHRVALLFELRFTHTVYTRVYTITKIEAGLFEIDCKWNFKSQTFENFLCRIK